MTVRRPFDKFRGPSTVEPSAPLRLDPERCRGVGGRNRLEPCSREAWRAGPKERVSPLCLRDTVREIRATQIAAADRLRLDGGATSGSWNGPILRGRMDSLWVMRYPYHRVRAVSPALSGVFQTPGRPAHTLSRLGL